MFVTVDVTDCVPPDSWQAPAAGDAPINGYRIRRRAGGTRAGVFRFLSHFPRPHYIRLPTGMK